jgi:type I restriction enzyme S subunit
MKSSTIKSSQISKSNRFDGSYHLSEGVQYSEKIHRMNFEYLGSLASNIFTAGRTKRVYTSKEFGYPYLSNTDVSRSNPFESCNYNSKKHGFDENSVLREGMIVTGRVGAIGQTSYISSEFEELNAMGSDNIIRIISKEKNKSGYIYSYLASKYGITFFNKLASGGVQPYISEDMIQEIPVPLIDESKQLMIHNLIVEASKLRVEANKLLKESQNDIVERINFSTNKKASLNKKLKISDINNAHLKRFESQFFNSKGSDYKEYILGIENILLKDVSSKIFRPGIFKRNYVKNGVDFLGGSDITKSIPDSDKKLSAHNTSNFSELVLKEDWILVTCGGTIGTTVLVNDYLSKKLASQHVLRIIPKDINVGYLFAFLSSDIGLKVIQSFTYGSVIPQIETHHLELVPIPMFDKDFMDKIHVSIMEYKEKINNSILKENQAIDLIEKEIDAWQ